MDSCDFFRCRTGVLIIACMPLQSKKRNMLRPAILSISGMFLAVVMLTLLSKSSSPPRQYELAGMPDPTQAAQSATETANMVASFHSDGDNAPTMLPGEEDEVARNLMDPQWATREGNEAATHAASQPFQVLSNHFRSCAFS